jgi:ketosteroid isomerase-like protein
MTITNQQNEIAELEKAFWDSIVDGKPDAATAILTEPAMMVSGYGAIKFDHAAYKKMASDAKFKLVDYTISDMDVIFPRDDVAIASYQVVQKRELQGKAMQMNVYDTSTWVKVNGRWLCAAHTESPVAEK